MALSQMNSIMLITLLVIIINQITAGSDSSDDRKPKFSFGMYEMMHKKFCENFCNIRYVRNRTSRTMILCLMECRRPQSSIQKPGSNEPSSSVAISINNSSPPPPTSSVGPQSTLPINYNGNGTTIAI